MGTFGTKNAAVIWRAVKSASQPMSETDIRRATKLGTATVHRLVASMTVNKFMVKTEDGGHASYRAERTLDEVHAAYSPPPQPPKTQGRQDSFYGQHIGRIPSVWALGMSA